MSNFTLSANAKCFVPSQKLQTHEVTMPRAVYQHDSSYIGATSNFQWIPNLAPAAQTSVHFAYFGGVNENHYVDASCFVPSNSFYSKKHEFYRGQGSISNIGYQKQLYNENNSISTGADHNIYHRNKPIDEIYSLKDERLAGFANDRLEKEKCKQLVVNEILKRPSIQPQHLQCKMKTCKDVNPAKKYSKKKAFNHPVRILNDKDTTSTSPKSSSSISLQNLKCTTDGSENGEKGTVIHSAELAAAKQNNENVKANEEHCKLIITEKVVEHKKKKKKKGIIKLETKSSENQIITEENQMDNLPGGQVVNEVNQIKNESKALPGKTEVTIRSYSSVVRTKHLLSPRLLPPQDQTSNVVDDSHGRITSTTHDLVIDDSDEITLATHDKSKEVLRNNSLVPEARNLSKKTSAAEEDEQGKNWVKVSRNQPKSSKRANIEVAAIVEGRPERSRTNQRHDLKQPMRNVKILQRHEKLEDVLKNTKEGSIKVLPEKKQKEMTKSGYISSQERSKSSDVKKRKSLKHSEKPITINIFEMISLTQKAREEQAKKSTQLKPKIKKTAQRVPNMLDSTAAIMKGKQREKPKEKKPSKLRKVILKDRMIRKSKFLQSLGLLRTMSLERINKECNLPLIIEGDNMRIEFPTYTSAFEHLQNIHPRVLSSLHSRRFREYCSQMLNKEIDESCTLFIKELVKFQDNQYNKDPEKARIKRRLVYGLREVTKHLGLNKIKCVVISPNLEKAQSEGGLDEKIRNIITTCQERNIPFLFALSRQKLGKVCLKKVPVSAVGILNFEGAEVYFRNLMGLIQSAREEYQQEVSMLTEQLADMNFSGCYSNDVCDGDVNCDNSDDDDGNVEVGISNDVTIDDGLLQNSKMLNEIVQ